MVKLTKELMNRLVGNTDQIRNVAVIAHVDHGKSTLSATLVRQAAQKGTARGQHVVDVSLLDTLKLEQDKGITIKSTGISMAYGSDEANLTLINLVDSPGHLEFNQEVTLALRVVDGAIVVVDCIEQVCVQTEMVLRQALAEQVRPVLCLNKLDRAFQSLNLSNEELYQRLAQTVESVNVIVSGSAYADQWSLDPLRGNVTFAAGLQGWAFSLRQFARWYAKKMGVDEERLLKRLWGANYYNESTRKWQKHDDDGKLERGFCHFVLKPLRQVVDACMNVDNDREALGALLAKIGVHMDDDELDMGSKQVVAMVMSRWLPAVDAVLDSVVEFLPSPRVAQAYRCDALYTGERDDATAQSMRRCDARGVAVVMVSKMIPSGRGQTTFAFGRVLSGTIESGQRLHVLLPGDEQYLRADETNGAAAATHGSGDDESGSPRVRHVWPRRVREAQTVVSVMGMMGRVFVPLTAVPAGNTVALGGFACIPKTATLVSSLESAPLRGMKFSVSPIVSRAVRVAKTAHVQLLVDALRALAQTDACVVVSRSESGEMLVSGTGELHVNVCLDLLRSEYLKDKVELIVSDPIVRFRETVTERGERALTVRSTNKLNRLRANAEPLADALVASVRAGDMPAADAERRRWLCAEHGWDTDEARRIWAWHTDEDLCDCVVDRTQGAQYLSDAKINVVAALERMEGVLCGEEVSGVRFNVTECDLHQDRMHRSVGQLLPASQKLLQACMLDAQPRLLEPMLAVDIVCPMDVVGAAHKCLGKRRAQLDTSEDSGVGGDVRLRAFIGVRHSFGFASELRGATSGHGTVQMAFSHWQLIDSDPLVEGTDANTVMKEVRQRKGMSEAPPQLQSLVAPSSLK